MYEAEMRWAFIAAVGSPDPSTQNGAILIPAIEFLTEDTVRSVSDCNRFPEGVEYNDERWERPLKYSYIEHAERNAIYSAAFWGVATSNSTLVCPWAACADCARAIVQAGITKLVRLPLGDITDATNARWAESCAVGDTIMKEGGVQIIEPVFEDLDVPDIRRDGKTWSYKEWSHAQVGA